MAKFFITALTVMLVMQGYVSWHVWRVLPFSTPVKIIIMLLMLLALACMVMQFRSDSVPLGMATAGGSFIWCPHHGSRTMPSPRWC